MDGFEAITLNLRGKLIISGNFSHLVMADVSCFSTIVF